MEIDRSKGPFGHNNTRKVEVKAQSSLFLISYTDVPSTGEEWEISVFIDIPTIDFYKDELANSKLSRFNKQFKLQHLKESIYKSLSGGNEAFWEEWTQRCNKKGGRFVLRIASSGSLRYVETIRFLVESVYERLQRDNDNNHSKRIMIEFRLDVSPASHKWFVTFLEPRILQSGIVSFNHVGTQTSEMGSSSPFKEYYKLLSKKFGESEAKGKESQCIESIVIVTNSTGVRALLTILSDRPLTNFITRESLEMLHDSALKKADSMNVKDDTPLKRESSSLLSFQNQLITSNKDKSVRIRSLSLGKKESVLSANRQEDKDLNTGDADEEVEDEDEKKSYEDKIDDDDEEDEEDEEDEGISFDVPSKLSHARSSDFIAGGWNAGMNGRVRSLSLMDPPLQKPFAMTSLNDEQSSGENMRITNIHVHDGDFQDPADLSSSTAMRKNHLKRPNKLLSRQSSANGLIPPEFYSRISSPSTSASSSNTSLQNFNITPGTFSKMAVTGGKATSQNDNNMDSIFEKNLINKSFEETRKNNLLDSILEKLQNQNQNPDKNGLALNFTSNKTIPTVPSQILDEEDLLMSGSGGVNINRNFSAEQISDDDTRSNSTVVLAPSRESGGGGGGDNDAESTNTVSTPTVAVDLSKIKLYDDDPVPATPPPQKQEASEVTGSSNDGTRPKYKKAFTLDLYGDDDLENSGGWLLGGNSR